MGLLSGMAYAEAEALAEEVKKLTKRVDKIENQLMIGKKLVFCTECVYRKTCVNTSQGIDKEGFCKWGVRDRNVDD